MKAYMYLWEPSQRNNNSIHTILFLLNEYYFIRQNLYTFIL